MNINLLISVRGNGIIIPLFIVLCLFVFQGQTKADNYSDSLSIQLSEAKDDTNKVNLIFQLSNAYAQTEYEKAIAYYRSGLALSDKLNYNRGELLACEKLGAIYRNIGVFDSAFYFVGKAISLAKLTGDTIQQAKNYNVYGSLLRRKGYYSSAMEYHQKALMLSEQINDTLGIANAYIYIAMINEFQLKYDTAINYYYKSMRMYEELGNKRNIGIALLNIGNLYTRLYEYKKANENFRKGLILFKQEEDFRHIGLSNNKIGIVYEETGKYDSALVHYRVCKIYYDSINNNSGLGHLNINMGNLYLNWGKYDSANYYFDKAMDTFKQMDFKRGYLNALIGKAVVYTKRGQVNNALEVYDQCQKIASQVDPISLKDVYRNIFDIYKASGNYKKAFEYQTKYIQINDSIFKLDKAKVMADVELKYEKEKDQAQILALENENLAKDLSLGKRTNQRNIYLFTGSGMIALILFLLFYFRQKARKDKIIASQKIKQLEEEKKLLAAKFLVEGQEKERKRIAKDLHDGLGVLLSTTKMQFTSIKDKSPGNKEIIDKATKMLEQATGDVRKISHNMMPGLLTRFGLYEATEDLVDNLNETEGLTAICEITGDTKRLPENTEIMLYRVIQELINNSLKHAEAKNIRLHLNVLSGELDILYTDDGKGFNVSEKLQLKSIGLNSIQSRIDFLGGNLSIQSESGKGVNCVIRVPVL